MIDIDQSPIGRTPRSNPATYIGALRPDPRPLRRTRGQAPRLQARPLQLQRQGRPLRGLLRARASIKIEMHFLPDVYVPCELRRQALQPRDARGQVQGQDRSPTCSTWTIEEAARVLRERAEDRPQAEDAATTSASTTSRSASRRRRSPAARPSASSSPPSSRASPPATRSTSSTNRRPACTSTTSNACWRCSSDWSTRATRSS